MACAVLCVLAWCAGDLTPVNDGLGWDGARYVTMMPNFVDRLFSHDLPAIYIARFLPYALLEAFCTVSDVDRSTAVTVAGFRAMNLGLLVASVWAWTEIARAWRLSLAAVWLGAIGLVVNVAALKWAFYLPVLTDQWGLACGVFAALGIVRGSRVILMATGTVAAFTWPTFAPVVAVLCLAAPRAAHQGSADAGAGDPRIGRDEPRRWGRAAAVVTTMLVCAALWYLADSATAGKFGDRFGSNPAWLDSIYVSVAIATIWVGVGAWGWWGEASRAVRAVRDYVKTIDWCGVCCAVLLAVVFPAICWALSSGSSGTPISARYAFKSHFLFRGIARPGVFLVAHVAYFGPLFILAAAKWPALVRASRTTSPSMLTAVGLGFAVSLNSESRHMLAYWALLLPWVIRALDEDGLSARAVWVVCAAQFVFSKVWCVPSPAITPPYEGALEVGIQRRDAGPWMTDFWFVFHAAALVLVSVCAVAWLRRRHVQPTRPSAI